MSSCRSAIDHPLGALGVPRPLHPDPCGGALDLAEIVGLAAADGAVVMNKHNELLGFGGRSAGSIVQLPCRSHILLMCKRPMLFLESVALNRNLAQFII